MILTDSVVIKTTKMQPGKARQGDADPENLLPRYSEIQCHSPSFGIYQRKKLRFRKIQPDEINRRKPRDHRREKNLRANELNQSASDGMRRKMHFRGRRQRVGEDNEASDELETKRTPATGGGIGAGDNAS